MDGIRLRCPATSANLASGYDVFGLALQEPYDIVEVTGKTGKGVEISVSGYKVPTDAERNSGGYVALRMMEHFGIQEGLRVEIQKNIQPARGLGSSAATAAGVAYALNQLFKLNLDRKRLVDYASLGEIVTAGFAHADNVGSAVYGGFIIIAAREPLEILGFTPPKDMGIVVAVPDVEKGSTKVAREAVPKMIPIFNLNYNLGHAALLAAGMVSRNLDLVKLGMEDVIVEPARAKAGIVKEYEAFKKLGKELNAGIAVSGAGPSILGVVEMDRRKELGKAMRRIFEEKGYACQIYETQPGNGVEAFPCS